MKKISLTLVFFIFGATIIFAQDDMAAYTEFKMGLFARSTLVKSERILLNNQTELYRQTPWGSFIDGKVKKHRWLGKPLLFFHFEAYGDNHKFIEAVFYGGFYVELPRGLEVSFSPIVTASKLTNKLMSFGTITGIEWHNKEKTCLVSGKIGYSGVWRYQITAERYLSQKFEIGVMFDQNRTEASDNLYLGKKNETKLSFTGGAQGYWGRGSKFYELQDEGKNLIQNSILVKSPTFGLSISQKF